MKANKGKILAPVCSLLLCFTSLNFLHSGVCPSTDNNSIKQTHRVSRKAINFEITTHHFFQKFDNLFSFLPKNFTRAEPPVPIFQKILIFVGYKSKNILSGNTFLKKSVY